MENDWKLKLKYGKIKTNFFHYTVLADGRIDECLEDFECSPGKAWMAMKVWASSIEEAMDMIQVIGEDIGFIVTGRVEVYETEPAQPPPDENPAAYDINFTTYE